MGLTSERVQHALCITADALQDYITKNVEVDDSGLCVFFRVDRLFVSMRVVGFWSNF